MPILSIIIPTYRRGTILRECLRCIENQTVKDQIEVIVVSDGEMDNETQQLAKESFQVPVTFLEIPKSQQGAARNRGVQEAKGEYVLFIGDDIFLAPDCCEVHLRAHNAPTPDPAIAFTPTLGPSPIGGGKYDNVHPSPCGGRVGDGGLMQKKGLGDRGRTAALGFTTWDPSLEITPVMRWLEETGWQFGYSFLNPHTFVPEQDQHRFTYASHISLPTDIARKVPFKEGIDLYGWEDVEWGMRLRDAGVRLFYEPDAKALHRHTMTMEDSLRRMETLGRSAVIFEKMHPEMHIVPRGWKRLAYSFISLLLTMQGKHAAAFVRGMNAAGA